MAQSKKRRKVPQYRTLRCPMVGHQASWCRGLCKPTNGIGTCGRPAPHVMVSRYQRAIAEFEARRSQVS